MHERPSPFLLAGAALSAIASALHVAIIFGGPGAYRFFGAGERFAQLDAAGSHVPWRRLSAPRAATAARVSIGAGR
jgi:hypothetical protein